MFNLWISLLDAPKLHIPYLFPFPCPWFKVIVCAHDQTDSVFLGFIWAEIKQMWDGGFQDYVHDWWNLMDFVMNSLYLATISLKIVAYTKVTNNL